MAKQLTADDAKQSLTAHVETKGVENIKNVNEAIKPAHPWFSFYGAKSADDLA